MRCPVGIGRKPTRRSLRGKAKDRALDGLFWPKVGIRGKGAKKIGASDRDLFFKCFFVDFEEVWGGFWEAKRVEKLIFLLVLGVCFLIP